MLGPGGYICPAGFDALGSGTNAVSAKIATFQPGGPDVDPAQNVFGTWGEIQGFLTANDGFVIIQVDDRFAAATTGGTGVTDGGERVLLRGIISVGPTSPAVPIAQLTITDGDQLLDFTEFENLQLIGTSTDPTTPGLEYTWPATVKQAIVFRDCRVRNDGSAIMCVSPIAGNIGAFISLYNTDWLGGALGAAIFDTTTHTSNIQMLDDSSIATDTLAGSTIDVEFDRSSSAGLSTSQSGLTTLNGSPILPATITAVIAGGVVTLPENIDNLSIVSLFNEGGADDDLDTLNGPTNLEIGLTIFVRKALAGSGNTFCRNGTGNLVLQRGDAILTDDEQLLTIQWRGTTIGWVEVSRNCGTFVDIRGALIGPNHPWVLQNGQSPGNNGIPYSTTISLGAGDPGVVDNQFTDGALDESCYVFRVPPGFVQAINSQLVLRWFAQNANAGNVQWGVTRQDIQDGDLIDGTVVSAATVNTLDPASGVANQAQSVSLAFNIPGAVSPGDDVVIKLTRDARPSNLSDTYAGNAIATTIELRAVVIGGG